MYMVVQSLMHYLFYILTIKKMKDAHDSALQNMYVVQQIKIWEDRKLAPLAVLRPHEGQPVCSATFLTAPHRPDHIILITAVYKLVIKFCLLSVYVTAVLVAR